MPICRECKSEFVCNHTFCPTYNSSVQCTCIFCRNKGELGLLLEYLSDKDTLTNGSCWNIPYYTSKEFILSLAI